MTDTDTGVPKAQMSKVAELERKVEADTAAIAKAKEERRAEAEIAAAKEAPPEATPPVKTPEVTAPAPDPGLQHRFDVLKGKYDTEVPRLYKVIAEKDAQIAAATNENTSLKQRVADLEKGLSAVGKGDNGHDDYKNRYGLTEEEADLGPEVARIVEKVVAYQQNAAPAAPTVAPALAPDPGDISAEFYATLATRVPEWKAINDSVEFNAWLDRNPAEKARLADALHNSNGPLAVDVLEEYKSLDGGLGLDTPPEAQVMPTANASEVPKGPAPPEYMPMSEWNERMLNLARRVDQFTSDEYEKEKKLLDTIYDEKRIDPNL